MAGQLRGDSLIFRVSWCSEQWFLVWSLGRVVFAAQQPVVVVFSTETAARSELDAPVELVVAGAAELLDAGSRKEHQKADLEWLGLLKIQNWRKSFYCSWLNANARPEQQIRSRQISCFINNWILIKHSLRCAPIERKINTKICTQLDNRSNIFLIVLSLYAYFNKLEFGKTLLTCLSRARASVGAFWAWWADRLLAARIGNDPVNGEVESWHFVCFSYLSNIIWKFVLTLWGRVW